MRKHLDDFLASFVLQGQAIRFDMTCDEAYSAVGDTPLDALLGHIIHYIIPVSSRLRELITDSPDQSLQGISAAIAHSVCGRSLRYEKAVKCHTCSKDRCSILCMDCFDESRHRGHNYQVIDGTGMCDCGFAQTIDPAGFCAVHCGNHVRRDVLREYACDFDVTRLLGVLVYLLRNVVFGIQQSYIRQEMLNHANYYAGVLLALMRHQNDLFRQALTNVLMYYDIGRDSMAVDDLLIGDIFRYIPKYLDVKQFLTAFKAQHKPLITKQVQLGVVCMFLPNMGVSSTTLTALTKYLVDT